MIPTCSSLSNYGIKAAGFSENRRTSGFNMMENSMFGGMTMKVSGENCGIVAKELADGGRIGVEIGEGRRRGGRGRGRSRVRKHIVGGFMYDMAGGRIYSGRQ